MDDPTNKNSARLDDSLAWVRSVHEAFARTEQSLFEGFDIERKRLEAHSAELEARARASGETLRSLGIAHEQLNAERDIERKRFEARIAEREAVSRASAQAFQSLETAHEQLRAERDTLVSDRQVSEQQSQATEALFTALMAEHTALSASFRDRLAEVQQLQDRAQASQETALRLTAKHQELSAELQSLRQQMSFMEGAATGLRARSSAERQTLVQRAERADASLQNLIERLARMLPQAITLRDELTIENDTAAGLGAVVRQARIQATQLAGAIGALLKNPLGVRTEEDRAAAVSFNEPPASLEELLHLNDTKFVHAAYACVLNRVPDGSGYLNYLHKLRQGAAKEDVLTALATSAEGARTASSFPGMRKFLRHRTWFTGRAGRAVGHLRQRMATPTTKKLRMMQNALAVTREIAFERSGDMEAAIARLESRLALASERLRQAMVSELVEHVAAAPAVAAQPGGVRRPLIIEFEYGRTVSPASIGESDDTRQLAVGFRSIELVDVVTNTVLCTLDMRESGNAAASVLFGFSDSEDWGTWSTGGLSALVLWPIYEARGPMVIRLHASIFRTAFSTLSLDFRTSLGHSGHATLIADSEHAELVLEAPRVGTPPMFFGAYDPEPDTNNVSNTEALPLVSIIILNYNKPVLSILASLAVEASRPGSCYEILIVDNGSRPELAAVLERMNAVARVVRNPANRFFGEGNNLGAEEARGEYLLFLNNDAFLAKGCVDELLAAFRTQPDCGAACPIFIYPDGRLQEAGAFIDAEGVALQRGKNDLQFNRAALDRFEEVDYGSAACLLIKTEVFRSVGGFNYRYDPAYYEDTDLCLRLKLIGRKCILARDAQCAHIENATTGDKQHNAGANKVLALNKATFLSTWGDFLKSRSAADLPTLLLPERPAYSAALPARPFTQATFSPFPLAPGGGERYLLATGLALSGFGPAAFATPDPYSQLRLNNVLSDLGLSTGTIAAATLAAAEEDGLERVVLMGNEALPRFRPRGRRAFFHCQFPFPWLDASDDELRKALEALSGFEKTIVNSEFTRKAYRSALARYGRELSVDVVYPPVATQRLLGKGWPDRKPQLLSIGRFTDQGHAKRQDVLISAMKGASATFRREWKLVLCGSVPNDPAAKAYFDRLRGSVGNDITVEFVISPSRDKLDTLLLESAAYAHATGYGVEHEEDFWKCEHFGITIVEAMAAGCSTFSYGVGGGPEIADLTDVGTTFLNIDELSAHLDAAGTYALRDEVRQRVAQLFSDDVFQQRMREALQ